MVLPLLHLRQCAVQISVAPVLGVLAVTDADDVGHVNADAAPGRRNAEKHALVRAGNRLAGDDFVAFGDLIV